LLALILVTTQFQVFATGFTGDNILESQQAVDQALTADLSLQTAKLNLEVAQQDFKTAKRILSIGGSYLTLNTDTEGWQSPVTGLTANSSGNYDFTSEHYYSKWYVIYSNTNQDNYSYDLVYKPFNLSYEKNIKIKELDYISQYLNYQNTRIKLTVEVQNAYAEVVQKAELFKLAIHDLELIKNQFTRTINLFNSGKIARLDLMDVEQRVKAAEVKLRRAVLNQEAGLLRLSTLLQKDNLKDVTLDGSTLEWATVDRVDLQATLERSLKNNPGIKTAAINIQVTKIQKLMDSFYLLKNVYICAGQNRTNGMDTNYYGFGFSGSLDDSYFRDCDSAKRKLEAAQLNLDVAIRDKRTKIQEAYRNWEICELGLSPTRESLDIAKERLRIANQKFERGMASGQELDQAYMMLNRAEEDYWGAWLYLQQARELFYQSIDGEPVLK
jgi:outer membrane protein TolC